VVGARCDVGFVTSICLLERGILVDVLRLGVVVGVVLGICQGFGGMQVGCWMLQFGCLEQSEREAFVAKQFWLCR